MNKKIIFGLGLLFLLYSIIIAIFYNHKFYVFFCLGYLLILDYVNYKLTRKSLLEELIKSKVRLTYFLIGSLIFAFAVDYLYGVLLFNIWVWMNYSTFNYIILYTLTNFFFILICYETFVLIKHFFKKRYREYKIKLTYKNKDKIQGKLFLSGIIFLVFPYLYSLTISKGMGIIMALPFISILLLSDLFLSKYQTPYILRIFKDKLTIYTTLITTLILFITHELINIFGREWTYLNLPFRFISVYGVPITAFIGWIILVLFCVSFISWVREIK